MATIDISGALGLIAMVVLTLNIVMGILISSAYKKNAYWQRLPEKIKSFKILDIHNYTAYVALIFVFLHFIIIPLDKSSSFNYIHFLKPLTAPHQPIFVLLGVVSFIALLLVIITTQKVIKKKLGTT
ncbi:MAG: hypothetical protein ACR2IM_09275, partial [Sediminibacterium sp.]